MVSVNKGNWDKSKGNNNLNYKFHQEWIEICNNLLCDNGIIIICGTYHNIYMCGAILQNLNYKIINHITWFKPNAAPNLSCKCLTASCEHIIVACKDKTKKYTFNYKWAKKYFIENDKVKFKDKQMRDLFWIPLISKAERKFGYHPTQKPLNLYERLIMIFSKENDIILDPFMGSGTAGVICKNNNRKFYGFENNKKFFNIAKRRIFAND